MALIVKNNPMGATVGKEIDDLLEEDKLELIKKEYKMAIATAPNYKEAKNEITKYLVDLPQELKFGVVDLSKINRLYAETQSYSSRVTALEVAAIDNASRGKRLYSLMEGYIEDKRSEIIVSDSIIDMPAQKADAKVRTILAKEYRGLRSIKDKLLEAESFNKMVEIKKKDLTQVLTTLGKQVKALALDQVTNR